MKMCRFGKLGIALLGNPKNINGLKIPIYQGFQAILNENHFSQKYNQEISPCRRARKFFLYRALFSILLHFRFGCPYSMVFLRRMFLKSSIYARERIVRRTKIRPAYLYARSYFSMSGAGCFCPIQKKFLCPTTICNLLSYIVYRRLCSVYQR